MAATYGYGGEFSSDEDIDRMEQQSEGLMSKFGGAQTPAKPNRQQIEDIINTISQIPVDQEITVSDEYLVGLLDYFKIQRGPVVDSTRKLYKRLVLKRIRDQDPATNGESNNTTNGKSENNNNINSIGKRLQIAGQGEPASSDDDEPMPPVLSQSSVEQSSRRKFDGRLADTNDIPEPMEVDAVAPVTPAIAHIRTTKQVDISSSEDESDEESNSDKSSDSEELDITPLKNPPKQQQVGEAATKIIASTPIKDSSSKIPPATAKESTKTKSKTPQYTRSNRVATRSSSGANKLARNLTDVSSGKVDDGQRIAQVKTPNKSTLAKLENCSRGLSGITQERLSVVEDENGEVSLGSTINGRKLNYAEKMVLKSLMDRARRLEKSIKKSPT